MIALCCVSLLAPACAGQKAGARPAAGAPAKDGKGGKEPAETKDAKEPADAKKAPASSKDVKRPDHALSVAEAEQYALALINRDRGAAGLPPVAWNATAATAGRRHAADMARGGFTAHWGTDGSVPELRYTEAGGEDLSTENAACYGDAKPRELDADGPFEPVEIERFQAAFMAEVPPADGHKKNILHPLHTHVGIGFATSPGSKVVCVAQEFIDDYGSYGALPRKAKMGDSLHVTGEMRAPAAFGGIGLARAPLPQPRKPDELLKTGGYQMPDPFIAYFPKGFKTPKPVDLQGNKFSLDLPLTNLPGPGIYEVQVFAKFPGDGNKLTPVSLRTVVIP